MNRSLTRLAGFLTAMLLASTLAVAQQQAPPPRPVQGPTPPAATTDPNQPAPAAPTTNSVTPVTSPAVPGNSGVPLPMPMLLPTIPPDSIFQQLQWGLFPNVSKTADQEKPDPKRLYREAITKMSEKHIKLENKEQIEAWRKLWLSKVDAEDAKPLASLAEADTLIEEALKSFHQRFDDYLKPDQVKAENKRFESSAVGVGVEPIIKDAEELMKKLPNNATDEDVDKVLIVSNRHPMIVNPVKGSPADKAGVKEGDRLLKVNDTDINGLTYNEVVTLIGGKENTDVEFTVERKGADGKPVAVKPITIRRSKFIVPVVKTQDLGDGITYVKLGTFAAEMADVEMQAALKTAAKGKVLIFDLRNNGGGRLSHAINIISYILAEGTIVVQKERTAEGMDERHHYVTRTVMIATGPAIADDKSVAYEVTNRKLIIPEDMPVILLVNGRSASASDLTAGALKFSGRAILVGTRTFGKGVGQTLIDLPYDRRLKVTSFSFFPNNKPVDWIGVEPHFVVEEEDGDVDVQLEAARKIARSQYAAAQKRKEAEKSANEEALKLKKEQWEERMRRMKEIQNKK